MNVAVVTGASKGLGEEFARQLAARRKNLLLVARSEEQLNELAAELSQRFGVSAIPFACDLSQPGAAKQVMNFMQEQNYHPEWLINNAGFGLVGAVDSVDEERLTQMMTLNVVALVDLTRLLLPELRLHRDARIINVSSTAAFQPVPFFNVYAASKAFVLHFSEALHEELRRTDVKVLALCPGPTPTRFHEEAGLPEEYFQQGQSAADVVRMALRASNHNRAVLTCQQKLLVFAERFMPRAVVRLAAGQVARRRLRKIARD